MYFGRALSGPSTLVLTTVGHRALWADEGGAGSARFPQWVEAGPARLPGRCPPCRRSGTKTASKAISSPSVSRFSDRCEARGGGERTGVYAARLANVGEVLDCFARRTGGRSLHDGSALGKMRRGRSDPVLCLRSTKIVFVVGCRARCVSPGRPRNRSYPRP